MLKWFKREPDIKSLEKELAAIAARITKSEARISYYRTTSRRIVGALTLYGVLIYAIYLSIWILFYMRDSHHGKQWFMHFLPVLVGPFAIHVFRRLIAAFYARKLKTEQANLDLCRSTQKEKIEEFKNRTDFYSTKSLIDRYSGETSESAPVTPVKKTHVSQANLSDVRKSSPRLQPQSQLTPNFGTPQSLKGTIATPASLSGLPRHGAQEPPTTAEFAPNAGAQSSPNTHWYDRILDVVIGEDEANEHSRYQLERKLRERDEKIAALELELIRLKPASPASAQVQSDTAVTDGKPVDDTAPVQNATAADGSTGIDQQAKRNLRNRPKSAKSDETNT